MPNTYTNLLYHLVFSTKGRQPLIRETFKEELFKILGALAKDKGGTLLACGGIADHVHMVVRLKPHPSISDLLQYVKANSSGWVNRRGDIQGRFEWQVGYSAFTVSESQFPAVREYVANQEKHHKGMSYQEELLALLKRHKIEYDERYLWD
jgi:REP element-mobilizing transposase RayT